MLPHSNWPGLECQVGSTLVGGLRANWSGSDRLFEIGQLLAAARAELLQRGACSRALPTSPVST